MVDLKRKEFKMLEIRKYTKNELSAVLGTNNKQGIDRKLQRYGVEFVSTGWGQNLMYEIQEVPDRFKLYCITEMGMSSLVNFEKFKYFCYYLFCDETFANFPIVEMEVILSEDGVHVSRQTISNWVDRLSRIGYIHIDRNTECIYYAITKTADGKKHYKEILREVYCKGWNMYWSNKSKIGTNAAYKMMYDYVGGHPYKRPKITENIFYSEQIQKLIELVNESFLE